LRFIEYNPEDGYAILRCSHKALEMVRASIAAITDMRDEPAVIHIIKVSGTLKALRRKITQR